MAVARRRLPVTPPPSERHIRVSNAYVRPDGLLLGQLAAGFARHGLAIPIAGVRNLSEAGYVLAQVASRQAVGRRGP